MHKPQPPICFVSPICFCVAKPWAPVQTWVDADGNTCRRITQILLPVVGGMYAMLDFQPKEIAYAN